MRVLDIGCGVGDVTMLVAQLVGPQGKVTSIDLDEASIATARKRTSAVGLGNTTFHRADILTFVDAEPFDAIVGRFVLEFVPEPAATVSRLCGLLRPGGIMAFQEPPTRRICHRGWAVTIILRDAFVASEANTEMELPLYQGFMAANLTSPQLRRVLPTGDSPEFRGLLYDLLLAVWERADALRLPLDSLGDPTTVAARLDDELDACKSFASFVCLVGMFARKRAD